MHHRITEAPHCNAALDAKRAAFDAPGITLVDNQIVVDPPNDDNCEIC